MVLPLPKLRWLVIGAIAASVWALREDMKGPRPPERVPTWIERIVAPKPKPSKPAPSTAKAALDRPVPPKPLARKSDLPKAVSAKPAGKVSTPETIALALPKTVDRPPARPQKIVTGSIVRPDKPTFVQTRAKVFMRAQAKPDAAIIATLAPRTVMRELARSGDWRLVMGDGQKGWVRADYLVAPTFLPRRPKLPVATTRQEAAASAHPKPR